MRNTKMITAVLCAGTLLLTAGCAKTEETQPEIQTEAATGYVVNYYNVENGVSQLVYSGDGSDYQSGNAVQSAPVQTAAPTAAAQADASAPAVSAAETPAPATQAAQADGSVSTGVLNTDEEKLAFFNNAVNAVKQQNPGFKKTKKTVGSDMVLSNGLVNAVANALKDSILPNDADETVVAKGESGKDVMSPSGKDYCSTLTTADITSIKSEQNGGDTIITLTVADMTNPDKETSPYSKIFDFITVDDIMNTYAPNMNATVERENVFFDFEGCWAKATVNANGQLTGYETFVSGTMRLTGGKIKGFTTDLNIVLSSTTTYTDFQW